MKIQANDKEITLKDYKIYKVICRYPFQYVYYTVENVKYKNKKSEQDYISSDKTLVPIFETGFENILKKKAPYIIKVMIDLQGSLTYFKFLKNGTEAKREIKEIKRTARKKAIIEIKKMKLENRTSDYVNDSFKRIILGIR